MKVFIFSLVTGMLAGVGGAAARNVDLSTIPPRDTVQLTIYNSEDLTLVRETRHLTFKPGLNLLQFSWANTLIDASSVELRFKTSARQLELLDTTFPHDKPQMLYWNVQSTFDGAAEVEITYFTSGISWQADYECVVDAAEQNMLFDGFVRITNNSGEDYADAQIRLVVGTINLVEKVAELARRGLVPADEAREFELGMKVARDLRPAARRALGGAMFAEVDAAASMPKEIVKQGLSEYFIYTIEGLETVRNTWSKRLRSFSAPQVPLRVQYRYRPAEYGEQLVRLYLLRNEAAGGLGTTPLPDGIVRLCRDNGRDGLSHVVQQLIKYVPIGQEIVLNLGPDPEVVHELVRLRSWRDNIWYRRGGLDIYYNSTQGHRIEVDDRVAGWDEHQRWIERIRNYRSRPIDVEMRRTFPGHVEFRSRLAPTLHDYSSPQFSARIEPGAKGELAYHLVMHRGYNEKQHNVTLEQGD